MPKEKTIEHKVSETILQKNREINIGNEKYQVAPPTTATLILASEIVSYLPLIEVDKNNVLVSTLAVAKDYKQIADVAAVLILGAKGITTVDKTREIKEKRYLWGILKRKYIVENEVEINNQEILAEKLKSELSPKALNELTINLFKDMEIGDFFGLTTFLNEINLIRQKKVEI